MNVDGTHVAILLGTAYNVMTLMQGMLMASGNDAAGALARGNQSVAVTVQQMNATAAELSASDTVARDPSGLDKADQHSSAYDVALIGRAAMRLPDFRGYVMTKQTSFPGARSADGKLKPGFTISNHNTLLFSYQGAIGVKNGYTIAAKFTYVEAATRGGRTSLLSETASPTGTWQPGCGDVGLGLRPRAFTHPDWRACGPRRAGREEADRRRSRTSRSAARHRTRIGSPACAAGLDRRGRR